MSAFSEQPIVVVEDMTIGNVKFYTHEDDKIFIPRNKLFDAGLKNEATPTATVSAGINGVIFIEFSDGRAVAIKPQELVVAALNHINAIKKTTEKQ